MSVEDQIAQSPVATGHGGPDARRSTVAGISLASTAALSNQCGAGLAALAFPAIGPAGVVAVRQVIAAVVLMAAARPAVRGMRWAQWWPVLALAGTLSLMNLSLYAAIDRIGLGLSVSLEFLGPLCVALFSLRRLRDCLIAVGAGVGVYILVLPGPTTDFLGVGLGLVAAACWAAYILLNHTTGQRFPGLQGTALATVIAAIVYSPVLAMTLASGELRGQTLIYAVAAGFLASAVPYAADAMALRRLPTGMFAVLTSLNPVWAALIGMLILGEFLAPHEWIGMLCITTANAALVLARRHGTTPCPRPTLEEFS
ncbi:EamA family transporter [Gordonia sp. CPCC 205515]|uniref:EamA family transporter n=1 Tax=Gordonia sp. CPCC 205515 TaxID=3140791 RepID=UPI003AF3A8D7